MLIVGLLIALGALLNSIMDIIKGDSNFYRSIFSKIGNKGSFWHEWFRGDWRNHYIDGNPDNGVVKFFKFWFNWDAPGILGQIPNPAQLWDAWHFIKFIFLINIIVILPNMYSIDIYTAIWYSSLIWYIVFQLFYESIWRLPKYRKFPIRFTVEMLKDK